MKTIITYILTIMLTLSNLSYAYQTDDKTQLAPEESYAFLYQAVNEIGQKILILGINHHQDCSSFSAKVMNTFSELDILIHETSYDNFTADKTSNYIEFLQRASHQSLNLLKGNWEYFENILIEMHVSLRDRVKYKQIFDEKQNQFKNLIESKWINQLPEDRVNQIKHIEEQFNVDLNLFFPPLVFELLNFEIQFQSLNSDTVEKCLIKKYIDENKQHIELDNAKIIDTVLDYNFILDLDEFFSLDEEIEIFQENSYQNADLLKDIALQPYRSISSNNELWNVDHVIQEPEDDLLVIYRNKIWEIEIQKAIDSSQSFSLLVGYHHLYGQDGLIKFLKDQHFTLSQILPHELI